MPLGGLLANYLFDIIRRNIVNQFKVQLILNKPIDKFHCALNIECCIIRVRVCIFMLNIISFLMKQF